MHIHTGTRQIVTVGQENASDPEDHLNGGLFAPKPHRYGAAAPGDSGFSVKEAEKIIEYLPELAGCDWQSLSKYFEINGRRLDPHELAALHAFFPNCPAAHIKAALTDSGELAKISREVGSSTQRRQDTFWYLFASLPLSEGAHAGIMISLQQGRQACMTGEVQPQSDSDLAACSVVPQALPLCHMPHLNTYLAFAGQRERLELPSATIFLRDTSSDSLERVVLSERETTAALFKAREVLATIDGELDNLKIKYRVEQSLLDTAEVDDQSVKEYFFRKHSAEFLSDLVENHMPRSAGVNRSACCELEVHFRQY